MVQPLWKIVWQFLTKPSTILPYYSATALLGIAPTDFKTFVCTKACTTNMYSIFIQNCQKLEATKMSFNRLTDKQILIYVKYWNTIQ